MLHVDLELLPPQELAEEKGNLDVLAVKAQVVLNGVLAGA
jgi:hypothetical protein